MPTPAQYLLSFNYGTKSPNRVVEVRRRESWLDFPGLPFD